MNAREREALDRHITGNYGEDQLKREEESDDAVDICRRLSLAYWPNPAANESANVERGDAAVDKLTLGELAQFYSVVQTGPTYCMVTRRVEQLLRKFPPHVDDRKERAIAAIEQAKSALRSLGSMLE